MKSLKQYLRIALAAFALVVVPATANAALLTCAGGTPSGQLYDPTTICQNASPPLEHVFSIVACNFVQIIDSALDAVYCGIQVSIIDILAAVLTVYIAVFGVQVLMGTTQLNSSEILVRLLKIGGVWVFATQATWGIDVAFGFFLTLIASGVSWVTNGNPATFYSSLDTLVYNAITGPFTQANSKVIGFFAVMGYTAPFLAAIAGAWLWLTLVTLARCLVSFLLGISAIAFLISLSPIFLSFMLFKATFAHFESWLRYMMSYALQIILIFAVLSLWLTITSMFIGFFNNLSGLIYPLNRIVVNDGPIKDPDSTWGICDANYGFGAFGPVASCKSGMPTDADLIAPSKIPEEGDFIYFVLYNIISLTLIAYAFSQLMQNAPGLAQQIVGPAYAPVLGGGWGNSGLSSVGMPGPSGALFNSRHNAGGGAQRALALAGGGGVAAVGGSGGAATGRPPGGASEDFMRRAAKSLATRSNLVNAAAGGMGGRAAGGRGPDGPGADAASLGKKAAAQGQSRHEQMRQKYYQTKHDLAQKTASTAESKRNAQEHSDNAYRQRRAENARPAAGDAPKRQKNPVQEARERMQKNLAEADRKKAGDTGALPEKSAMERAKEQLKKNYESAGKPADGAALPEKSAMERAKEQLKKNYESAGKPADGAALPAKAPAAGNTNRPHDPRAIQHGPRGDSNGFVRKSAEEKHKDVQKMMETAYQRADKNKDGKLDVNEQKALRREVFAAGSKARPEAPKKEKAAGGASRPDEQKTQQQNALDQLRKNYEASAPSKPAAKEAPATVERKPATPKSAAEIRRDNARQLAAQSKAMAAKAFQKSRQTLRETFAKGRKALRKSTADDKAMRKSVAGHERAAVKGDTLVTRKTARQMAREEYSDHKKMKQNELAHKQEKYAEQKKLREQAKEAKKPSADPFGKSPPAGKPADGAALPEKSALQRAKEQLNKNLAESDRKAPEGAASPEKSALQRAKEQLNKNLAESDRKAAEGAASPPPKKSEPTVLTDADPRIEKDFKDTGTSDPARGADKAPAAPAKTETKVAPWIAEARQKAQEYARKMAEQKQRQADGASLPQKTPPAQVRESIQKPPVVADSKPALSPPSPPQPKQTKPAEHKKTPGLPEGYIAPGTNSFTNAVDSATLARNGDVHVIINRKNDSSALDSHVEINIKDDPRLEALRAEAKEIGKKYGDKNSSSYIADGVERERRISQDLIEKVSDTYGKYSGETAAKGNNAGEKKSFGTFFGDSTSKLADMEKGSLVCRHYAPVMSVLLNDAGVANHLVTSATTTDSHSLNTLKKAANSTATEGDISGHMYVVTDRGGIVEGTVAGHARAKQAVYRSIVNNVSAEGIVYHGKVAITADGGAYGGHGGDGAYDSKNILSAWKDAHQRYQEQKAAQQLADGAAQKSGKDDKV